MKEMWDNTVDAIVTDPPYELGFMGKSWDSTGIAFSTEVWEEALRVLKPGGHLIAFSGSRTYHRMAVAIEDAGFEIRDQIMWVYGSGFPKSMDISKAIDKRGGATADFTEFRDAVKKAMKEQGIKTSALADALGNFMLSHYLTKGSQPAIPNYKDFRIIRDFVNLGDSFNHLFAEEAEREVVGTKPSSLGGTVAAGERNQEIIDHHKNKIVDITIASTPAAKQWEGWGTALKPAHEPMVLARKPVVGTVANNVLTYGVGGLNIDGSRVGTEGGSTRGDEPSTHLSPSGAFNTGHNIVQLDAGRWPANFIHDGLDIEWAKFFYCAKTSNRDRNEGLDGFEAKRDHDGRAEGKVGGDNPRNRTNAAKLNHHPTVKPTSLMQYLVRLVTPPNGTVLDPFMGSGSTGKACAYEGFDFIGIDQSTEYAEIARARINFALENRDADI